MKDVSIILPMATSNEFLWLLNSMCLRTCRATAPDAEILVLGNNSPHDYQPHRDVERQCVLHKIRYEYVDGPFNQAKFFNLGTDRTKGKYVVYGSADLLFYKDWLTNLLRAYEKRPEFFFLAPWGFHTTPLGLGYHDYVGEHPKGDKDRILTTHWISTGIEIMRRDRGYRFDERFPDHELDTDYHLYAKANKLPIGIVTDSQVDHYVRGVRGQVNSAVNYGDADYMSKASQAIKEKWGTK